MVRTQLMNTNPEPPARHGKNQVGMKTCSLGGAVAAAETALKQASAKGDSPQGAKPCVQDKRLDKVP